MQQQGAQFGVFTGEGGQAGAIGQRLSNTEIAAQKAVAALESKVQVLAIWGEGLSNSTVGGPEYKTVS
eukprot:1157267-Pelagomonas_calceolata.AAC.3